MVIDDDEAVMMAMAHLLRSWGYNVNKAATIQEAVTLAKQSAPDFVVSNYRLRGPKNGLDAIALFLGMIGAKLPALLVTCGTSPERLRETWSVDI